MANKGAQHSNPVDTTATPAITPKNRWLSVAVILVRIVVGLTFIFSGVVKLIDPIGTMYKIEEYMVALHLSSLQPAALVAAIALSLAEFILGIDTLLGSYLRATPKLLLAFMALMTPLTLYLAIANPIPDCGCFGDAVVLTNWQTFIKNVVLLVLVIFLYKYYTRAKSVFHREVQAFTVIWGIVYAAFLVWHALTFNPILDFRPFKPATDILSAYQGEGVEEVEYEFVYQKNGERKSFTLDNLPDEEWEFIERKIVSEKPSQDDTSLLDHFVIYDGNENVTEEILEQEGYIFIMFSHNLNKADDSDIHKIHELYDYCLSYDYPFYAITASSPQEIDNWLQNTGGEYSFLFMDSTSIKTIARSNPFVLVMKDGVLYHKLPIRELPEEELLHRPFDEIERYSTPARYNAEMRVAYLIAALVLPIMVLYLTERIALFFLRRFRRKREQKRLKKTNNNNQ